uniref:Angiotensin-converting enzyme n=1 Tax=Macrostomum lignano TaxID=282301 RepID=A0A1I8HFA5_9PLAT
LSELHQSLQNSYSHIAACPKLGNNSAAGCLPVGEQAVSDVLANASASYDYKLSVWRSWYDSAAGAMATNFTAYVRLANSSARQIGYGDFGEADWRSDFESDSFNSDVLAWYAQLSDLYTQLQAYVRHRLSRRYPGKFRPDGCLPAHILGHDQWAQQWSLQSEDFPRRVAAVNYTDLLVRKFGNFTELVRAAEGFYKSLGMPAMTKEFWQRSDFFKPANSSIVKDCHASAWEFANRKDFRIKMCGRVRAEDFNVIHHEMGHIEYFMAYSRQPREFRNSANSGFHEAVGDTMSLSVNTRAHFATLGMLPNGTEAADAELNRLFSMALEKVAFLPFALTTGVFRWLVFNGTAGPDTYNRVWWGLRARYGGICPPVDRPSEDSTPEPNTTWPRTSAIFAIISASSCSSSCTGGCASSAGTRDRQMLKSGSSRPWQETLREFTKEDGLQTSALLEYFRPLHAWLADYNKRHGVPVGWKVPKDVLKGVAEQRDLRSSSSISSSSSSPDEDVTRRWCRRSTTPTPAIRAAVAAAAAAAPSVGAPPSESMSSSSSRLDWWADFEAKPPPLPPPMPPPPPHSAPECFLRHFVRRPISNTKTSPADSVNFSKPCIPTTGRQNFGSCEAMEISERVFVFNQGGASRALSGPARYLCCSKVFSRAKICCPLKVGRVCFRLPSAAGPTEPVEHLTAPPAAPLIPTLGPKSLSSGDDGGGSCDTVGTEGQFVWG